MPCHDARKHLFAVGLAASGLFQLACQLSNMKTCPGETGSYMASGNDNHKTSETVFRNFRLFSKYDKILISKPTGPVKNVI